jgi:hypothetical protein
MKFGAGSGLRKAEGDYSASTRPVLRHYSASTPMKKVEKNVDRIGCGSARARILRNKRSLFEPLSCIDKGMGTKKLERGIPLSPIHPRKNSSTTDGHRYQAVAEKQRHTQRVSKTLSPKSVCIRVHPWFMTSSSNSNCGIQVHLSNCSVLRFMGRESGDRGQGGYALTQTALVR